MHIAITGSTGLVGSRLVSLFSEEGHRVTRFVRREAGAGEVSWDPSQGKIDASGLEDLDAVIHLAGENVAARRWTKAQKGRIRDSRVNGTRLLCETLVALDQPPRTLISASAVGYYGDRGDEELDEASSAGRGFLADVAREWESATEPAVNADIRVALMRFGVILSSDGGALAKMLPVFRMGGAGVVGSGRQYFSWISLDDAVGALLFALKTETVRGPVNVVAPHPVTNAEFTKSLGALLHRPTLIPLPAFAARLALGEMADGLLLASARVQPRQLLDSGFAFRHATLEEALRDELSL